MKRTLSIAAVLAVGAGAANACGLLSTSDRMRIGAAPCAQPSTSVTTFGNGLIINTPSLNTPGHPVATAQPFGTTSGVINSSGQQTRICRSFGSNSLICH